MANNLYFLISNTMSLTTTLHSKNQEKLKIELHMDGKFEQADCIYNIRCNGLQTCVFSSFIEAQKSANLIKLAMEDILLTKSCVTFESVKLEQYIDLDFCQMLDTCSDNFYISQSNNEGRIFVIVQPNFYTKGKSYVVEVPEFLFSVWEHDAKYAENHKMYGTNFKKNSQIHKKCLANAKDIGSELLSAFENILINNKSVVFDAELEKWRK